MNYKVEIEKNKDLLLNDLFGLLRIDTVFDEAKITNDAKLGTNMKEALEFMLSLGEKYGFKTKNVENVAGHIEFGEGDDIVGILCHLDVVPTGNGWKYGPFEPTIEGDKLYARGSNDDKGPCMSILHAMKVLKDSGFVPKKRVRLIMGTDEETAWRGINRYLEVEEMPNEGFSPDADFPIIYGEKGITSIDIISKIKDDKIVSIKAGERYNVVPESCILIYKDNLEKEFLDYAKQNELKCEFSKVENGYSYKLIGKGAHAMEPNNGVNALIHMAKFITKYHNNNMLSFLANRLNDSRFKTMGLDFSDPEMKDLTVNVALCDLSSDGGKVGINMRCPINWNEEEFINKFSKELNDYQLEMHKVSQTLPHYVNQENPLIKTLRTAYDKYTTDRTPNMTIGGGTYARAIPNAVAFGMLMPGREDVVHQVNEHIYISDLLVATAIYTEAIFLLTNK